MQIDREPALPIYHVDLTTGLKGKYSRVADCLPRGASVLELGCSSGYFGRALIQRGHRVVGVEGDPDAAALAEAAGLDVIQGDLENPFTLEAMEEQFDVILLMDVLEHLRAPEKLLIRLRSFLKPSGLLIVTGPNVAYWRVRLALLLGEWRYTETGILDCTHLRFYTLAGWEALIRGAGYELSYVGVAEGRIPAEDRLKRFVPGFAKLRHKLIASFPKWFGYVFLLEARLGHE